MHIKLFGGFRVLHGGELVAGLDTPRLQALLAYAALRAGTPQLRHHVAATFWPDSKGKQALTNLRQLLHYLRHALPESDRFLRVDAQTIQWNREEDYVLDVTAFEESLALAEHAEGEANSARAAFEQAVHLYAGDLLPSCYDEWIEPEREWLRERYIAALDHLIDLLEKQRAYPEAVRYARLLLQKDPLRETTYCSLMRLHAVRGDRASELRVFHECTTVLERELGVAPGPMTRELHERLMNASAPQNSEDARNGVLDQATHPGINAAVVPLVGRQREWERLTAAWGAARSGRAHLVSITGEAGIGKTRLAEEAYAWVQRQGVSVARSRCYSAEGRLAFAPLAEWLRTGAFDAALRDLDAVWRDEIVRILPELTAVHPDLPRPEPLTESWQRRRLFEALARCVLAVPQPILLLVDDLQWCDLDTLEWVHFLLRFDPRARLLVLGTARIEELEREHPLERLFLDLRRSGQTEEVTLGPLSDSETTALAEHVMERAIDADQAAYLYGETEGNPLFIVEGVRAGLEPPNEPAVAPRSRRGTEEPSPLPAKVRAIFAARLAQLSPEARELAQVAATVGRSFAFEVLAVASDRDENGVVRGLDELWQRRIVREHGESGYDFSHGKLREVAYDDLHSARRRVLHRRVAEAIEAIYSRELDAYSGQLAVHFERAGLPGRALPYYQRASEVAQRVHAHAEALGHIRNALDLLDALPGDSQRDAREVDLLILLGTSLVTTKGWADPEVGRTYERARSLCSAEEQPIPLLHILFPLRSHHVVRAELETARRLGMESLQLAQRHGDRTLLAATHLALTYSLFHLGEFESAREHVEHASTLPDSPQPGPYAFAQRPYLGVFGRSYESHVLWHLGYPEEALTRSREALACADALADPFCKAIALAYAAILHQFRREPKLAGAHAEAAVALCGKHEIAYYLAWGAILQGWADAAQGEPADGRARMRRGLDDLRATGARLRQPYYLALMAEAASADGDVVGGLALINEALTLAETSRERWQEAELHRLKGEVLLQGEFESEGDAREAEDCFRRAFDVATHQGSRSLALRAAVALHRLHRCAGSDESRPLLQGIYDSFTEGLDTVDLREARALLSESA